LVTWVTQEVLYNGDIIPNGLIPSLYPYPIQVVLGFYPR